MGIKKMIIGISVQGEFNPNEGYYKGQIVTNEDATEWYISKTGTVEERNTSPITDTDAWYKCLSIKDLVERLYELENAIANKMEMLHDVAFSGCYTDLKNKPELLRASVVFDTLIFTQTS